MKLIIRPLLGLAVLLLGGCVDNKPEMNSEGPTISNRPMPVTKEDVATAVKEQADGLRRDVSTSQNAIQQNIQSLVAAPIGKLSDDLIKATIELKDLLHVEFSSKIGQIKNDLAASVASNNELRAMLKVQMEMNTNLQAQLNAQVEANVKLSANVQAGFNNKLDTVSNELKSDIKAGRDANSSVVQFNKEMLDALRSANEVSVSSIRNTSLMVLGILLIAAVAVGVILWLRGSHAEDRAAKKDDELRAKQGVLERALAFVPAEHALRAMGMPQGGSLDGQKQ